MIFDCHTHWGVVWADRDGADPASWLHTLDTYGLTHAIVLGHRGIVDSAACARDHNDVAAVCAASDGRMLQFATVHPSQGRAAVDEAVRCLDNLGVRGLKFHPWLQGETLFQPVMDELAELAAERAVPLYFHDGTPCYSMPSQVAGLARRHPRTTMVLGHGGLLELWREGIAAVRRCPNLWACLCGPHPAAHREYFKRCDRARLLWGSDFGFGFSDPYAYRLGMVRMLGQSDDILQAVFETNPCRLLGIKMPEGDIHGCR